MRRSCDKVDARAAIGRVAARQRLHRGIMRFTGTITFCIVAAAVCIACAGPAHALDLNAFRARHGKPPLAYSSTLAGYAQAHASGMAGRGRLDHAGFRQRFGGAGGTFAENVAVGCDSEDCAIRMWAKSAGHRRNMLRGDVSAYGIASAAGANGRRYWVLSLGN